MATGNEEALTTPCVKDGKIFGLDPFSMAILKTAALRLRGLIYHMRVFFSTKARKKYYHMRV